MSQPLKTATVPKKTENKVFTEKVEKMSAYFKSKGYNEESKNELIKRINETFARYREGSYPANPSARDPLVPGLKKCLQPMGIEDISTFDVSKIKFDIVSGELIMATMGATAFFRSLIVKSTIDEKEFVFEFISSNYNSNLPKIHIPIIGSTYGGLDTTSIKPLEGSSKKGEYGYDGSHLLKIDIDSSQHVKCDPITDLYVKIDEIEKKIYRLVTESLVAQYDLSFNDHERTIKWLPNDKIPSNTYSSVYEELLKAIKSETGPVISFPAMKDRNTGEIIPGLKKDRARFVSAYDSTSEQGPRRRSGTSINFKSKTEKGAPEYFGETIIFVESTRSSANGGMHVYTGRKAFERKAGEKDKLLADPPKDSLSLENLKFALHPGCHIAAYLDTSAIIVGVSATAKGSQGVLFKKEFSTAGAPYFNFVFSNPHYLSPTERTVTGTMVDDYFGGATDFSNTSATSSSASISSNPPKVADRGQQPTDQPLSDQPVNPQTNQQPVANNNPKVNEESIQGPPPASSANSNDPVPVATGMKRPIIRSATGPAGPGRL